MAVTHTVADPSRAGKRRKNIEGKEDPVLDIHFTLAHSDDSPPSQSHLDDPRPRLVTAGSEGAVLDVLAFLSSEVCWALALTKAWL